MSKQGRTAEKSSSILEVNGLTLDLNKRLVTGDNGVHHLTPMECRLLKTFMTYPDRIAWLQSHNRGNALVVDERAIPTV